MNSLRLSGRWSVLLQILCVCFAHAIASAASDRPAVINLNTAVSLEHIHVFGPGVSMKFNANPEYIHRGTGSLEIIANEKENPFGAVRPEVKISLSSKKARPRSGYGDVRPAIELHLSHAIDLRQYRAISLWVYVPKSAAAHFFGRYDVRLAVNGGNPYWSFADVSPGWNHVVWNFARHPQNAIAGSGSGATRFLPVMHTLTINLGPLMSGYGLAKVYLDDIRLVPMRRLVSTTAEELESVLGDDDSWSRRYQAVERLKALGGLRVLPALINATEDSVPLIRGTARRAMDTVVESVGKSARGDLLDAMNIGTPRMRLAVVQLLVNIGPRKLGRWVIPELKRALLDNDFYVRRAARYGLAHLGISQSQSAQYLMTLLSQPAQRYAAIRALAEIGPAAKPAIPDELQMIRDAGNPLKLRLWALRAVWWTHERFLKPTDWILAFQPHSNAVYRHLTDLAMLRLEKAGAPGVTVLTHALLTSREPVVRARAAEALGHVTLQALAAAEPALRQALHDSAAYVRWQVRDDLHRLNPVQYPLAEHTASRKRAAAVRVTQQGNETIFSNGIVRMVFNRTSIDPGPVSVQLDHGPNLVHSRWVHHILAFRKSKATNMFERQWLQKLGGSAINKNFQQAITHNSRGEAEYVYTFPATDTAPLTWEEHYVLRRGNHGFYVYFLLKNMTGKAMPQSIYPGNAQSIALEFNFLVAATRSLFTTKMLNDNLRGPISLGFPRQNYLQYPDIYQATWRLPNGEVDAKHEWMNYEQMSPVLGLAGPKYGMWLIFPSRSFLGGTEPTLQMTAFVGPLFIISLENKYYVPACTYVSAHWQKLYGPMYFYLNTGANTDAMWIAAKHKALQKEKQWPFAWLHNKAYHQRGEVTGTVKIANGRSPRNAWVILSLPPNKVPKNLYGDWLRNINSYMYWTRAKADGSYTIKNIQPGHYDLFVWKSGILGEVRKNGIVVKNGGMDHEGTITLTPLSFGRTLWQIGTPNRTVTEFRNGGNFHIWENYLRYGKDFPHGVNYVIGKSTPARDWNYLQPAIVQGHHTPTTWNIDFKLKKVPAGSPVLTMVCGGRNARLNVFANGHRLGQIHTSIGLQFVRTAPYGELILKNFVFRRGMLHAGWNKIALTFATSLHGNVGHIRQARQNWTSFMAYDCIRLSMRSHRQEVLQAPKQPR